MHAYGIKAHFAICTFIIILLKILQCCKGWKCSHHGRAACKGDKNRTYCRSHPFSYTRWSSGSSQAYSRGNYILVRIWKVRCGLLGIFFFKKGLFVLRSQETGFFLKRQRATIFWKFKLYPISVNPNLIFLLSEICPAHDIIVLETINWS